MSSKNNPVEVVIPYYEDDYGNGHAGEIGTVIGHSQGKILVEADFKSQLYLYPSQVIFQDIYWRTTLDNDWEYMQTAHYLKHTVTVYQNVLADPSVVIRSDLMNDFERPVDSLEQGIQLAKNMLLLGAIT